MPRTMVRESQLRNIENTDIETMSNDIVSLILKEKKWCKPQ